MDGSIVGVEGLTNQLGLLFGDQQGISEVHEGCEGCDIRVRSVERGGHVKRCRISAEKLGHVAQEVDQKLICDIVDCGGPAESLNARWVVAGDSDVGAVHGLCCLHPDLRVAS